MTVAAYTNFRADANSCFSPVMSEPSGYALFTLPYVVINGMNVVTDEKAIVSVPVRCKLLDGCTGSYTIRMGNGVTGIMTISRGGTKRDEYKEAWEHGQMINNFSSHASALAGDFIELHIKPVVNWLEPGQRFHVFRIPLAYPCHTENIKQLPPYHIPDILFGIQRPD